ncbi:MAG: 50S ribosomal protein L3 [Nitrospirae bacterium]|nr:50S ribosomal protein L3 [Nitrospirota bacterium]
MVNGLIGIKHGMTQIFTADGRSIPVTVVEAGPCHVVTNKTVEKDGYEAVQLSFKDAKEKHLTKPLLGHFKKNEVHPSRHLAEFKGDIASLKTGQEITVEIFKEGDMVDVTGVTIGKGFQGVVKRHKFAGGPATHGSMFHRAPGSIGSSAYPSRVRKNKRLPGHMGNKRRTVQNLEVVVVRKEDNILLIKGAMPGSRGSLVFVKKAIKGGE